MLPMKEESTVRVHIVAPETLVRKIDAWRVKQPHPIPSRSEAMRALLRAGLDATKRKK